jgi:hypothetical protein
MALSQATLELLIALKDNASAGLGSLGGALGNVGLVAGGAALAGVTALGAAIVVGTKDALEAREIYAQTQAVIESTGGAAGYSADQIADMASSLSDASGKSLFGDDDIERGQNMLLTFTNIKETLPDATQTMLDMSQALGQDMKSSAMQLGKALNDPIAGVGALSRVGVTFTKDQEAMIKEMAAAGDTAGAQRLILAELSKEFGGSAQAAAQAAGGQVQFMASLGETFEMIGGKLLPILDQFGAWLNSPEVQAGIAAFADALANGITIAAAWISDTLIPALQQVWAYIQANVIPVLIVVATWLKDNIPPAIAATADFVTGTLIPALRQVWAFLDTYVIPVLADVADWLITNIPPAIAATADFVTGTLIPALQQVWAFIDTNILPILGALVNVGFALVKAEIRVLSELWTGTLQPALEKVWSFIQTKIMPILSDLASDISAVLGPAIDGLGKVISPIAGWFDGIGTSVGGVVRWLNNLATGIDNIHVPSWLQGHSPPPLANWFSDIAGAAESAGGAVDAVQPNGGSVPSLPSFSSAGAGGGGQVTVYVTVQGSVTTQQDLVRAIRDSLNQFGRQNLSIFAPDVTP